MRTFVIRKNGGGFRFLGLAGAWAAVGAFGAVCGLRAAFAAAFRLGGLRRCGRGDGGELCVEWLEDVVVDVFAADLEAFEEGLVEEAAFGGVGLAVGGLDVVGEVEREVEGGADVVGLDLVAAEQLVGGDPFAANPHLLLGEE